MNDFPQSIHMSIPKKVTYQKFLLEFTLHSPFQVAFTSKIWDPVLDSPSWFLFYLPSSLCGPVVVFWSASHKTPQKDKPSHLWFPPSNQHLALCLKMPINLPLQWLVWDWSMSLFPLLVDPQVQPTSPGFHLESRILRQKLGKHLGRILRPSLFLSSMVRNHSGAFQMKRPSRETRLQSRKPPWNVDFKWLLARHTVF